MFLPTTIIRNKLYFLVGLDRNTSKYSPFTEDELYGLFEKDKKKGIVIGKLLIIPTKYNSDIITLHNTFIKTFVTKIPSSVIDTNNLITKTDMKWVELDKLKKKKEATTFIPIDELISKSETIKTHISKSFNALK